MDYRPLGRTGISVSQLCLGAMMFGPTGNPDHDDSVKIIHRALGAGINFIDTADAYSHGESEEIVGEALAGGRRDPWRPTASTCRATCLTAWTRSSHPATRSTVADNMWRGTSLDAASRRR
jgi:predicted aldo/keto reductase-like oxidoreductase